MKNFIKSHFVEILFSIVFITLATVVNLQFLKGSNLNSYITGHDEYLTVREVYSIVNPLSFRHFVMAIISGDIMYYGRVMFYTDALFAYIPYKIWGIEAMVFAIRMTHSLWILMSLLLFVKTFIKTTLNKFLYLLGTGGLTYTLYFMSMPKPEPLQLFFLVLFFRGLYLNNFNFGKYFIWLGLAFATKINVLVLLPLFFLLPFFSNPNFTFHVKKAFQSFLYFLIGFVIGIPSLALGLFKPIFWQTYLNKVILGSDRPYDDSSLGVINWIEKGLSENFLWWNYSGYLFLIVAGVLIITRLISKRIEISSVVLSSGLILCIFIFVFSKRLWPHYLWTGYILCISGMILVIQNTNFNKWYNVFLKSFIIIFIALSSALYIKVIPNYVFSESSNEVHKEVKDAQEMYKYLASKSEATSIGTDGSVYFPFDFFLKSYPYHPFSSKLDLNYPITVTWHLDNLEHIWEDKDWVVFRKYHPTLLSQLQLSPNIDKSKILNIYNQKIDNQFRRDTAFGNNIVYKKM